MTVSKLDAATFAALDPPILPEGTQVIRREGWYQILNPLLKEETANEVLLSRLRDSEVDQRVGETIALYRAQSLPFKWAIGPMSSPDALERKIAPLASISWEFRGMAIDTDVELRARPEVRVERVGEPNFESFLEAHLYGWSLGAFAEQTRAKLLRMVQHPRYRCFVAFKDGQAIGSASTVLKEGYGYLTGAVVLERHRGSGAYKALIQARLRDLRTLGVGFAVTQAREATSAPILEKIGFETVYNARIHKFDR